MRYFSESEPLKRMDCYIAGVIISMQVTGWNCNEIVIIIAVIIVIVIFLGFLSTNNRELK